MFIDFADNLSHFLDTSRLIMPDILVAMGILWVFNIINWMSGSWMNAFGIHPRRLIGIPGILLSPILHGNFNHLFFNSMPLFMLGLLVAALDIDHFQELTLLMIVMNGTLVWLFGRRANHIGASGLVSAYFGYALALAYFEPTAATVVLGFIALYYFGSILLSLFPTDERVSWESHLMGFLTGLFVAWQGATILVWIDDYTFSKLGY